MPEEPEATAVNWLSAFLNGKYSHALSSQVYDGLPFESAGAHVDGVPYTIWQLLQHTLWWQDWWLARLQGLRPAVPQDNALSWTSGPAPRDEDQLAAAVARLRSGVALAEQVALGDLTAPLASDPSSVVGADLVMLAEHNSYHAGQVVLLRRLLGCWRRAAPPETGTTGGAVC